jgi:hypothetical protein
MSTVSDDSRHRGRSILFFAKKLKLATKFHPSKRRLNWTRWRKSYTRDTNLWSN